MGIKGAQVEPQGFWPRLKSGISRGGQSSPSPASVTQIINKKEASLGLLALLNIVGVLLGQINSLSKAGSLREGPSALAKEEQKQGHWHNTLTFAARLITVLSSPLTAARDLISDLSKTSHYDSKPEEQLNSSPLSAALPNHKTKLGAFIADKAPGFRDLLGPKLKILDGLLDQRVAGNLGALVFAYETMFSNLFLKINPEGTSDSFLTSSISGFSKLNSILGSLFSLPGHTFATILRFGNTDNESSNAYKSANFFARLGDVFLPLSSNFNSLLKSILANNISKSQGISPQEALKQQGLNFIHLLQGSLGVFLALPSFLCSLSRFSSLLQEKDSNELLVNLGPSISKKITGLLSTLSYKFNLTALRDIESNTFDNWWRQTFALQTQQAREGFLSQFCNLPFLKQHIFKHIVPYNPETDKLVFNPDPALGLETLHENRFWGSFNKVGLLQSFDHVLRPIQSTLMLLPSMMPTLSDPEIQERGKGFVQSFDKILGLSSIILSVPSFLIYVCSSRIPKLITWYLGQKQKASSSLQNVQGSNEYEAYKELLAIHKRLANSNFIPFGRFIAQSLKRVIEHPQKEWLFHDDKRLNELLETLEREAQEQERPLMAAKLIESIRSFMKYLMRSPLTHKFFTENISQGELSGREKAKQRIYESIDSLSQLIKTLVPGLGLLISAPLNIIKNLFKVRTPSNPAIAGN